MSDLLEAAELALSVLKNNKPSHYACDDTWYSCPKHSDECDNDFAGGECNCGADEVNEELDRAIIALERAIEKAKGEQG